MRLTKNKYASLPKTPIAPFETDDPSLVLHFKMTDGRFQKIDLGFFIEGAFPRPQIGKACAEVFRYRMQDCAQATRKNTRRALKVFNDFLNWRAAGGTERQISSTSELNTALLIEFQAYLDTVCTLQENSANNIYLQLISILRRLGMHRPEALPSNLRLPGSRFKSYRDHKSEEGIIGVNDLKQIADAALKEVHQIRENHRRSLSFLESTASLPVQTGSGNKLRGYWKSLANVMHSLVREQGIAARIPVQVGQMLVIHSHPPPLKLIGWYAPTSENYFDLCN